MREELRRESDTKDVGLSTADLANMDEPKTIPRKDKGLDKSTAELESRQIDFHTIEGDSKAEIIDKPGDADRAANFNPANANRSVPAGAPASDDADENRTAAPLFSSVEAEDFHQRWNAVQVGFVDEPRKAVQQADSLVAGAMKRLAEIFAEERAGLDQQWDRGGDVSTEDLRIALRRYRSFFGRLLSV